MPGFGRQHARSAVLVYFGKMGLLGSVPALRRLGGGTGQALCTRA
jgi:hypothetical protein